MKDVIRAEAWGGFHEMMDMLGGDADSVLSAAKVDSSTLNRLDGFQSTVSLLDTMEIASDWVKRPDLGLIWGDQFVPPNAGPLTLAVLNAETSRAGLEVSRDFMHIHMPAFNSAITPIPGTTHDFLSIDLELPDTRGAALFRERWLALMNRRVSQLCLSAYKPVEIHVPHPQIAPLAAYVEVFGIEPRFEQRQMGIIVERAILDAPRPYRNPEIFKLAITLLKTIGEARDRPMTATVTSMARSFLEIGDCTAEKIARALGVHERTLQRRLKDEGTAFETIKDEARKAYAEALLKDSDMSILQIALALGYSDTSAFTRASRRWFGETPSKVRRILVGSAGVI